MTLTFFVLPLKDINYDLSIINLSQILIMTVPCCYKVSVFMLVAILLLIECTNLAKADNQAGKIYNHDSYEYYPPQPTEDDELKKNSSTLKPKTEFSFN